MQLAIGPLHGLSLLTDENLAVFDLIRAAAGVPPSYARPVQVFREINACELMGPSPYKNLILFSHLLYFSLIFYNIGTQVGLITILLLLLGCQAI